MRSRTARLLAGAVLLHSVGCADRGEEYGSDDYPVTVTQAFADAAQGRSWTAREVLRLGSIDGSTDSFGRIVGIALGNVGEIYVADGQSRTIQAYTPDGVLRATLGGRGDGPGEFRTLSGIAGDEQGRVWGVDPLLHRMTAFGPGADDVNSVPHRENSMGAEIPWRGILVGDSVLYELQTEAAGADRTVSSIVRSSLAYSGIVTDAVTPLPPHEVPMISRGIGNISMRFPVPFSQPRRWAVSRDESLWLADGPGFVFVRLSPEGDTALVARVLQDPPSLTASDRDSLSAISGLDQSEWPPFRPSIHMMTAFGDDSLLIAVEEVLDSISWYVIGATGKVSGHVHLDLGGVKPDFAARPVVRDGYLILVVTDQLEVPFVVKFRLDDN